MLSSRYFSACMDSAYATLATRQRSCASPYFALILWKICCLPRPQKFPPMGTIATINARNKRLFLPQKRCLFPKKRCLKTTQKPIVIT